MDIRNIAETKALLGKLEQYYGAWHSHVRAVDTAYHLDYRTLQDDMLLPEGVQLHVPSTGPTIVDTLRDQIIVDNYTVEVIPHGVSIQAIKSAALLSRLGHGFIDRINESGEVPLLRQLVFDSVLRGAHCAKVLYAEELLPKKPERGDYLSHEALVDATEEYAADVSTTFPYRVRPIDPLMVFPSPGRTHPLDYIFEVQERHASGVGVDYPTWSDPMGQKLRSAGDPRADDPLRRVKITHIWTKDQYGVLADDEWVLGPGPNPYGFVPYIFAYSGWGRVDEFSDPVSLGVTGLSHILSELRAEVVARTTADALWQLHAYPILVTRENPIRLKERKLGPGAVIQGDPDNYKYLERPAPPSELYMHLQKVEEGLRKATGTEVLSGQRPKGVDYGYLQALMIGQARLRLDITAGIVQRSAARLLSMMFRLQKLVVRKPVRVWGVGGVAEASRVVRPDDIDNYNVVVHLDAVDPAENDQRVVLGLHPLRAGVMSRRAYLRDYRRVADVEEEEAEILKDRLMEQLLASGAMLPYALRNVQAQTMEDEVKSRKDEVLRMMGNRDVVPSAGMTGQGAAPAEPPGQMTMEPGARGPLSTPPGTGPTVGGG